MANLNFWCPTCGWVTSLGEPHDVDCNGVLVHTGVHHGPTEEQLNMASLQNDGQEVYVVQARDIPPTVPDLTTTNTTNASRGEVRTVSATGGEKGAKLARFDLIPPFVLKKLAEHYGRGALKYADHNWRRGYSWSLSISALHRHLNAFEDGEDYDVCQGHETDCAFVDKNGVPFPGVPGVECYNHTGNHHLDGVNFHGFALRYFAEFLPQYDDRFTSIKKDN